MEKGDGRQGSEYGRRRAKEREREGRQGLVGASGYFSAGGKLWHLLTHRLDNQR